MTTGERLLRDRQLKKERRRQGKLTQLLFDGICRAQGAWPLLKVLGGCVVPFLSGKFWLLTYANSLPTRIATYRQRKNLSRKLPSRRRSVSKTENGGARRLRDPSGLDLRCR